MPATGSPFRAHRRSRSKPHGRCPRADAHRVWPVVSPVRAAPTRCRSDHWGSASRGGRQHGDVQLSTFGTPHPRCGCQRRNHNRFLRLNNFVDRLLAREATGISPAYSGEFVRKKLAEHEEFMTAFKLGKERISRMEFRFVEEPDPIRQTLLEV